ncbi:hypothetical protein ACF6ZU_00100 [Pseudomonas migulae]|uniref:hypothetical protein n=1 Tax=Pseudomonas migulae TaxID=78543 RepID=UPI0037129E48
MSDVKVLAHDLSAWDQYAAAALNATIAKSTSPEQAVIVAAELADGLLAERAKRVAAANDYITSKKK